MDRPNSVFQDLIDQNQSVSNKPRTLKPNTKEWNDAWAMLSNLLETFIHWKHKNESGSEENLTKDWQLIECYGQIVTFRIRAGVGMNSHNTENRIERIDLSEKE